MFRARVTHCDDTQLGTRVPWLHCVRGACYEGEETRREGCIAPLFTQYQIENNVECLLTIVWYFYLNVLLFVWVGNETLILHTGGSCSVVSGQGCVIMTSFGPSLGGLPSLRKLCPIFRFVM